MRKRGLHKGHSEEEPGINLTPLIDVVFVVLIMFIIVAPILELDHIQLANSAQKNEKDKTAALESSPISIHVHADNSIWINSKLIGKEQLLPFLKEAKKKNPHRIPQLFHDKKAQFGTYQTVKNAVEVAGFEQMDVILEPN